MDDFLDAALHYASLGWHVLPLRPRDKRPLTRHGVNDASTDPDTIERWWSRWPDANVGIATGTTSGLVVVDVDGPDGWDTFRALQGRFGGPGDPLLVRTGSGWHAYYATWGLPVGNSARSLGPGLDVRGNGGYVVAPPSVHPSGCRYEWHTHNLPGVPPFWLRGLLVPPPTMVDPPKVAADGLDRYVRAALERECTKVATSPIGCRNTTLNCAAFSLGTLVGAGVLAESIALDHLVQAGLACGLHERETIRTARSGLRAGAAHPRDLRR